MQHPSPYLPYFVGFARLEDLLDTHYATRVVYCAPSTAFQPDSAELIEEHWAVVADIQDSVCRYWRMRLAAVPLAGGGGLRPDPRAVSARVDSALAALRNVITARRFRIAAGLVAIAPELPLVSGETGLIAYDRRADLWREAV
jgi:hypothetical protein